jgi:hypothetical protein
MFATDISSTVGPLFIAHSDAYVGDAARDVAARYLGSISAYWCGERDGREFERWLSTFWDSELPPCPCRTPDAVSPHGGGGRGIDWYETPTAVVGYVAGSAEGYRIPIGAIPPRSRVTAIQSGG